MDQYGQTALPQADEQNTDDKLYIYALIRADLQMPPGKLAAQAGHAYTDALWACLDKAPDQALAYRTTGLGGSKVTIQAKNLAQLERAARECAEAGIPHAVVTDAEHVLLPHFTGAPIVTALGIGPVTRAQCRHITKRFQVVQGSAPDDAVRMDPAARRALLESMRSCEQTAGMTVLRHGEMVRDHYRDLMDHLRFGSPLRGEWRLPEWIGDPLLLEDLPSDEIMAEYHVFHDCGKPVCRTVDAEGRQHFPDHAAVSARIWAEAGGDPRVGDLIAMDMDVHLLRGEEVDAFSRRPEARALLLTALAEIHANASMFGGIGSVGFKSKWKHLDRRGRAILKAIAAEEVPMAA